MARFREHRTLIRRTTVAVGAAVSLSGAFTLGVVAGAGSTPDHDAMPRTGVLDDAASQIAGSSLLPVDKAALDAAAIKAMLATAGDHWGSWAEGDSTNGAYAGVGIWLRRSGTELVVSQVAADSPAHRAGVAVGDLLRGVDGRATTGLTAADVASALRGNTGTTVKLVLRRGIADRSLTLTRAEVPALEVTSAMVSTTIGRITVPSFSRGTGRQVRDALARLVSRHAAGVVLDLRGDPGGLLTEAVETASAFLDGGTVVTYTRRDAAPTRLDAVGIGNTSVPLVVLVDGGTASAAEVVAGALQDRGRAVVVGSRTFGKGTVQEPKPLTDGSSLALTVARYNLPSGRSVDGVGIEPDIEVVSNDGRVALHRAMEVLVGLQADTGGRG
ncbi:MAG: carboxyl-terminal protease [Frankiales bacterium]|jgi:carboxyl-terminal processing protease|nr:carboxyl-terminal protease [Frankiales bacterium]